MAAPVYQLFEDESGLPHTVRRQLPYETEALTPREVWGHGHGSTTINCRVKWNDSVTWIQDMVGEVRVVPVSSGNFFPTLVRHIPERLRYGDSGGNDKRVQWCTGVSQIDQGGNPPPAGNPDDTNSDERFAQAVSNWPRTLWCRYAAQWETTPYFIRTDAEINAMQSAAGNLAGARELLRYVVRERKVFAKEQPIPAATNAGGFKVIDDSVSANRRPIGQVGFRIINMAEVIYRWVRVPVGWPPIPGWVITNPNNPWPPFINPASLFPATTRCMRDAMIGRVNATYFDCVDPEGYCWRPGELLYQGYDEHRYFDAAGYRVADFTFKFRFKEGGWNKFLDARGYWREVSADITAGDGKAGTSLGRRPYTSDYFDDLFQPIGPVAVFMLDGELRT